MKISDMNISPARHWNTWDSVYPLRMIHLPSGIRLTPCAYSSSAASFTRFAATAPGLLLGERDIPGTRIDVSLSHCGTEIDWRYDKPEPASVRCHWKDGSKSPDRLPDASMISHQDCVRRPRIRWHSQIDS